MCKFCTSLHCSPENLGKHYWSLYVFVGVMSKCVFHMNFDLYSSCEFWQQHFGTLNSLWHLWLILFTAHICLVPLCLWQFFFCLSCFHLLYVVFCSSQREEILAVFWFSAVQSLPYFPYYNITTYSIFLLDLSVLQIDQADLGGRFTIIKLKETIQWPWNGKVKVWDILLATK